MHARHGKHHPLGNVGRVIPDALKIFGDHEQIERVFAVVRLRRNLFDEAALDLVKIPVDHIVIPHNLLC